MIKYIGKVNRRCEMCYDYGTQIYLDNKDTVKGLFPEVNWKEMHICEKCARRETGSKHWKAVKRHT